MGRTHSTAGRSYPPATQIVDEQLDAYNAGDTERFLAAYAPDVRLEWLGGEHIASGHGEMRRHYQAMFAGNPKLKAEIVSRIAGPTTVIDLERVSGRADGVRVDVYAIFEVAEGLIQRAWFRRETSGTGGLDAALVSKQP